MRLAYSNVSRSSREISVTASVPPNGDPEVTVTFPGNDRLWLSVAEARLLSQRLAVVTEDLS